MATLDKKVVNVQGTKTTQKTASKYATNVIEANKEFKKAVRNVGTGLKLLKLTLDNNKEFKEVSQKITKIQKSDVLFKKLDSSVRRLKENQTCIFYILQAVNKMDV